MSDEVFVRYAEVFFQCFDGKHANCPKTIRGTRHCACDCHWDEVTR